MLTKLPTASFNVGSFLLAIGLPMTTRSVADSLAISNAKAECNSVNSVVPLCLANWARADCSSFVSDVLTIFCVFPAAVMAISYSSACFSGAPSSSSRQNAMLSSTLATARKGSSR